MLRRAFGTVLATVSATALAVILPISAASAAPIPGDGFFTTDDYGAVLALDPVTGIWQYVGVGNGTTYFGGMDVDPLTGNGYAVLNTAETPSQLFTVDVATGTLTSVGEVVYPAGETALSDCRGIDFTAGLLSLACTVEAGSEFETLIGTVDFDGPDPAFTLVGILPAQADALAVAQGVYYAIDAVTATVWTLPVGGGIRQDIGTVTREGEFSPAIAAADFDSAGQLWAIDMSRDAGDLLQIDLTTFAAAVTPFAGPDGENVNTQSLTITGAPAAPAPAPVLPGTGADTAAAPLLGAVAVLVLALGVAAIAAGRRVHRPAGREE